MIRQRLGGAQAFQINCTPPEEKKRRQKRREQEASHEMVCLLLVPFCSIPRVAFENVKLGHAAVRHVTIQNPGQKPLKVALSSMPKSDRGFEVDFAQFTLPGRHEVVVRVGWVPQKGGNVREKIGVKYGSCMTQILLVGSCVAPVEQTKSLKPKRTPLSSSNLSRNRSGVRGNKAEKETPKPSVALPKNPVERELEAEPEFRPLSTDNVENQAPNRFLAVPATPHEATQSWSPQKVAHISQGTNLDETSFLEPKQFPFQPPTMVVPVEARHANHDPLPENLRRETFVKDPPSFLSSTPAPSNGDIFKFYDVSAIKNASGNLCVQQKTSQSAEKCSTSKELKFDEVTESHYELPPFKMPVEQLGETDERVFRRETFVVDEIRSESSSRQQIHQQNCHIQHRQSNHSHQHQQHHHHHHHHHHHLHQEQYQMHHEEQSVVSKYKLDDVSQLVHRVILEEGEEEENGRTVEKDLEPEPFAAEANEISPSNLTRDDDICEEVEDIKLDDVSLLIKEAMNITEDSDSEVTECQKEEHLDPSVSELKPNRTYDKEDEPKESNNLTFEKDAVISVSKDHFAMHETREFVHTLDETREQFYDRGFQPMSTLYEESSIPESFAQNTRNLTQTQTSWESLRKDSATFHVKKVSHCTKPESNQFSDDNPSECVQFSEIETIQEVEERWEEIIEEEKHEVVVKSIEIEEESRLMDVSLLIQEAINNEGQETTMQQMNEEEIRHFEQEAGIERSWNENERTFDKTPETAEVIEQRDASLVFPYPSQDQNQLSLLEKTKSPIEMNKLILEPLMESHLENEDHENIQEIQNNHVHDRPQEALPCESTPFRGRPRLSEALPPPRSPNAQNLELFDKTAHFVRIRSPSVEKVEPVQEELPSQFFEITFDKPKKPLPEFSDNTLEPAKAPMKHPRRSEPVPKVTKPKTKPGGLATVTKSANKAKINETFSAMKRPKQSLQRLTLIKPMKSAQSRSTVRHPNPFAAKNMYYDERWIQKQESGFTRWLNFILTPEALDDKDDPSAVPGKIDVTKVWKACSSNVRVPRAPTREVMSMRAYTVRRKMNQLRRHACTLWQTPGVAQVITKVEIEIEKKGLIIRKDKSLNKDVGMKKSFLELLLSYNPLWLKIGLETIYGELLSFTASDVVGLSQFILTRMLSNPDIQAEFAHPHVPHHFGPGYEEALKQYTLKKFLQVVFFLDQAKKNRLIKHDPCLFCKDSKVKMSKDVLVQFSRDFLAGEGDVIKHLAYLGFIVNHKQTPLDEFDYAVTNLAIDLKDGIRLSRVAGLFTSQELSDKLRMPAQSRLQKVHNVELALKALRNSGNGLPKDIDARSIVDGHMEKTLSLMWHIIYGFQLDRILDEGRLQTEIKHLFKSLEYRRQIGDQEASKGMNYILECKRRSLAENFGKTTEVTSTENDWMTAPKMKLLLEWARLVCAHYALEVENLTVSFSDGRCLCFMLHHYYPSFLPRDQIKMQTMMAQQQGSPRSSNSPALNCSLDDSFGAMTYSFGRTPQFYDELLNNEKANFKLIHDKINELGGVPLLIRSGDMSNTIPDQKVTTTFLIYLAARLLDLSVEMTAARTIQLAWRKHHANKVEKQLKRCHAAAKVIQFHARRWLHKIHVQKYLKSTLAIQRCYRKYITRKRLLRSLNDRIVLKRQAKELALLEQQWRSAIQIQTLWRQYVCRKRFLSLRKSCLMIQAMRRKKVLRVKADLELQNKASRVIQRAWRRFQVTRRWLLMNQSAISIQCWFRQILARRLLTALLATKREQACVKIQSWFRMTTNRKDYLKRKRSCILIQAFLRGSKIRNQFSMATQIAKDTALPMSMSIDEKLHLCLYQAEHLNQRAVEKAELVRKYLVANQFQNSEDASLSNALLKVFSRTQLLRIESLQPSAIIMQRIVRNWLQRLRSAKIITSSLVIQRWYKRIRSRQSLMSILNQRIVAKEQAKALALQQLQRDSAIKIQSQWRQYVCRKRFLSLRRSCLMVQAMRKKKILKIQADQRRKLESALIIQRAWKRFQRIRQWKRENHSALVIQCWYRQIQAKRVLERLREKYKQQACLKIQTWFRTTVQRQKFVRILQATIVIQKHYKGQLVRNTFKACEEILSRTILPVCESKQEKMIHVLVQISEMTMVLKDPLQSALTGTDNLNGYECALRRYHDELFCRQQLKLTKAANLIQTAISRWLNVLQVERKTRAAVIIQSFFFRAKARQALCLEITNRISHKRLLALTEQRRRKKASVLIQRAWRQHRAKLVQQRQYEAAITVQCWFRRIRAKKILNLLIKEHRNEAAIKLQAWTRMWMARKKFLRVLRATLIFQKAFRGQRLRKTIRLTQMITNATLLPLHVPLTEKNEWFLVHVRNLINNAQDVQLCHRIINVLHPDNDLQKCTHFETAVILCHQACVQKRVMNCHGASIVLQRFIRGWLTRTRYFRQRQSAISIQKFYKKNKARRSLISIITERILVKRKAKELAIQKERNQAATVIQSQWRRFVLQTQFLTLRRACLVIQAITRKKILRAKADRELKEKSAFIIQKAWKRFLLKKTQKERNCAAITLQCWYRNIQAKRIVDEMRAIKRHRACLKIQSWFRMKMMERKFGNLKRAAIVIQKFSRGSVVRKSFGLVKEIQAQTLLPLSSSFRAKLAQRKIGENYENIRVKHIFDILSSEDVPKTPLDLALLNLFNTIRKEQLMTLSKSAKTIQQAIKKWLQRRRHQKEVEACVQIQRFIRKSKLRHQLNRTIADRIIQKRIVREEMRQNAALLIQTHWRRCICRKRYIILRRACVRMQTMIRQKIQQAKAHLELETKAATVIQGAFRRYQAAQKWQLLRKSATMIQCWYRQILAKRVLRHLVQTRREKSALTIQRAWKRYQFFKQWKLKNASAITIQCWYRQVLAKRALQTLIWQRREVAAYKIQRAWKRFQAVQKWKLRNAASTKIQSWYRRIIAKRLFDQLLQDRRNRSVITIQRAWKRYQAIKLWKLKNVCATTIQSWYREILAKKYLYQLREARQKESAIKIQRAWKRYRCVKRLKLRHTASIKIQCWFRQIQAKQLLISLRHVKRVQACFKIQRAWRRFQEVQRWKMEKLAATKIQLWYREILVQRELKILLDRQRENACRKLQMAWRRYRVELKEKVRIRSIIRIQSWYRQVLARRTLETLRAERNERLYQERAKLAGITVQSALRMWMIRKEFLRIRRAVIVIQKVYRGHRVREAFKATCKIKQEVLLPDYEVNEELGKKIEQARQKVQIANQNATEDKKLGNRTAFALDCLYTSRDMAQLLQILNDLDVSTRFSANCCDQIVAENDRCIRILLDLLLRCNRSIPHMELIGTTLDVFISLAKYEPSRVVLNGMVNELVGTIIEVLHIFYKDKFVDIYNKGFALLWLMSFDDQAKTIMCSTNISKKILEMHKFYHRIHTKQVEKEKRRSNYLPANFKKSQAKFKCKKLSLCPPWKMRADEICHHKEPFLASEAVLKKLSLKPLPLP